MSTLSESHLPQYTVDRHSDTRRLLEFHSQVNLLERQSQECLESLKESGIPGLQVIWVNLTQLGNQEYFPQIIGAKIRDLFE